MTAVGNKIGPELCEALGLDPMRVLFLSITVEPNDLVIINAKLKVDVDQMQTFGVVTKKYQLVVMESDDEVETTSLGDTAKRFEMKVSA